MRQPNNKKYYNNLRSVLRYKEECRSYFQELDKLNRLQKKANWNLFLKIPLLYLLRFFLYLPVNTLRLLKTASDRFYLLKLNNEVEVLKDEIKIIDKINGQNY